MSLRVLLLSDQPPLSLETESSPRPSNHSREGSKEELSKNFHDHHPFYETRIGKIKLTDSDAATHLSLVSRSGLCSQHRTVVP
jgi:hypothetical protein